MADSMVDCSALLMGKSSAEQMVDHLVAVLVEQTAVTKVGNLALQKAQKLVDQWVARLADHLAEQKAGQTAKMWACMLAEYLVVQRVGMTAHPSAGKKVRHLAESLGRQMAPRLIVQTAQRKAAYWAVLMVGH